MRASLAEAAPVITADAFARRARARLRPDLPGDLVPPGTGPADRAPAGSGLAPECPPRAAAVLVPVVAHAEGATVLLTERTAGLRDHAGQIAFPGGKVDPTDASPWAAALREAQEEIGLDPGRVTPLGYLDPRLTGTGFLVVPTVGLVEPPLDLRPNPREVEDAFEVPLAFLMDPGNHQRLAREIAGRHRHFDAMPYGTRYIWGLTAGILRDLHDKLFG